MMEKPTKDHAERSGPTKAEDQDERLAIPLDHETALAALLRVDPKDEPAGAGPQRPESGPATD